MSCKEKLTYADGVSYSKLIFKLMCILIGCRYEGTGRSLSLKLLQQLRSEGAKLSSGEGKRGDDGVIAAAGRTFREVQLQEPIRCQIPPISYCILPHSYHHMNNEI